MLDFIRRTVPPPGPNVVSDGDLLARFTAVRDEDAYRMLVRRHGPMVLGVARRVLRNGHAAEDVFQATFLALVEQANTLRRQPAVAAWLYRVAVRISYRARPRVSPVVPTTTAAPDAASLAEQNELRAGLDAAVERLPEKLRRTIVLCYFSGHTTDEAARLLDCPPGTVRSRLAAARDKLRTDLTRRGITISAAGLTATLAGEAKAVVVPAGLLALTMRVAGPTVALTPVVLTLAKGAVAMSWMKVTLAAVMTLTAGVGIGVVVAGARQASGTSTATNVRLLVPPEQAAKDTNDLSAARLIESTDKLPEDSLWPNSDHPMSDKATTPEPARTINGLVIGPDDKPLPGAKLIVPKKSITEAITNAQALTELAGTAGPDGRFSLRLTPPGQGARFYVIAHAAGFGVDWVDLSEVKPSNEITFRLLKDVPITGRVVSTEGKPVAGVTVSAASIYVPKNESLDDYLSGWMRDLPGNLASPQKRLYIALDGVTGAATTDMAGEFTLHGAGAERIVRVTFHGGGVARSTPYIITRPGFDPKPFNDVLLKKEHDNLRVTNRFLGLYSPSLTFVAEAGKTVEGVVKDAASGKSLPGCSVFVNTGFGDGITVMSELNGRYRIDGLPKKPEGYSVGVAPPKDSTYLQRRSGTADTDGYAPVKLDIELVKGVVVTGRVVDRQTGKGVQAGIRFAPLPDNRFFASKPGFDNYLSDHTMTGTDKDGYFRLVTIPGQALVTAQVHDGEKFYGDFVSPYRLAVPDPDQKELFKYDSDDDDWSITTAGGVELLRAEHAVKVIDIKDIGETAVNLFADRGVTAILTVQDAEGNPLTGAWVAGLAAYGPITFKLPEATTTVFALNHEKPRTLTVYHPERSLAGTVTIRGDEKEPVVVKLGTVGKVIGRLVEVDGSPLAGAQVSISPRSPTCGELYRKASPVGTPVLTDKDGRFTLSGVIPGISFSLRTRRGQDQFRGNPRIGWRQLKSGESLDLGDQPMEPIR